jgi:hypothetical protein
LFEGQFFSVGCALRTEFFKYLLVRSGVSNLQPPPPKGGGVLEARKVKGFGGTGFQPVQAQAKAWGYILSIYPLTTQCKMPAGHYWGRGDLI